MSNQQLSLSTTDHANEDERPVFWREAAGQKG